MQSLGVMGWTRARGRERCNVRYRLAQGQHKAIGGSRAGEIAMSGAGEIAMSGVLEGGMALSTYFRCALVEQPCSPH
jgi:hypothetical protein